MHYMNMCVCIYVYLYIYNIYTTHSINILREGHKSPVQEGFLKNSAADILPASRFLGGLYTFCNFVNDIFFNVSLDDTLKYLHILQIKNDQILPKNVRLK